MDEKSLFFEVFMGLLTMLMGLIGYNLRSFKSDHDALKEKHGTLALNLSENYAKKTDLNAARQETTASLERIHARIDDVGSNVDKKMDTVINLLKK